MGTNLPSFDKAEFETAAPRLMSEERCVRCQQTITERFFRLGGKPVCEPCANAAVGLPAEGAGTAFVKALAVGMGAALVGCILYAVVEIATGWTIGYVAVAVGWLVGKGMKIGSEGRGGRQYQVAAAVLTYLSVSFASLVMILHAAQKRNPGGHILVDERFVWFAAKYGLLSPLLELRDGLNGIIGVFILFIGIRTAWTMMAGSGYSITGPHPLPNEVAV